MKDEKIVGSFQLMKSLNKSLILNTIRAHGSISRSDIAKETKLTPPTVTNIVNELLEEGLVKEWQTGSSSGGRKPILLKINSSNFYVFGIDISPREIRFAITDLNAQTLLYKTITMKEEMTSSRLFQMIAKQLYIMMDEACIELKKFVGIGIGIHGRIDADEGSSGFALQLQHRNVPLKKELEKEFRLPVKIENDVRAMAIGENWFGSGVGISNLVCIKISHGVGAGFILNKKLFHGTNGLAGEIGHMFIESSGLKCSCGNDGCLEALVGSEGIKQRTLNKISLGYKTKLIERTNGMIENVNGELIYEAALEGDLLAKDILEETGRYLGIAIMNIIHLFNPERIIIGGGLAKAKNFILTPIQEVVEQRALTEQAKKTEIVLSKLGDQATVIGAVALVLNEMFSVQYESVS
ncbi:ROK family transcriptional regulator [Aeribacillus pallidus]|nr:ROK family transcriptional regulator [Aeribacillus pallidus]